jgi:adenylate cyclase
MLVRHTAVADPFGSLRMAGLWAILWGALAALLFYRVLPQLGLVILAAAAVAGIIASYGAFALATVRVTVVAPFASALAVYAATSAYRFALGLRERRLIRRAFQHYLAPAIVQQILEDPSRLKLGGESFDVTVIFTDLEGFTTYAEHLAPDELRSRLSTYFTAMMDVLLAERATLDKFIGDAIMVYFGCPIADPMHPAQACRAALAMQRRLDALNDDWHRSGVPPLRMRIGVNTGTAVAGNMGTDEMFNYTIIGDCVNLASRLEGVNKQYGTRTIIGADTWQRVRGQFEVRELDWIRVKGKTEPVAIYELLADKGQLPDLAARIRDRYEEALSMYRAGDWGRASRAFAAALELEPSDGPSRVFTARCADYAAAPPREWDGVHVMTVK